MENLFVVFCISFVFNIALGNAYNIPRDSYNNDSLNPQIISIYFGWNRSAYSTSDLHFFGDGHDFTIENATASDRQTPFSFKKYFGITTLTIPQTNMGISYQVNPRVSLSFNVDHMKYVLDQNQVATINGEINTGNHDFFGTYADQPTEITEDLVRFEHSDGLNYLNFGYTRSNLLFGISKQLIKLQANYGGSLGVMLPKTNSQLLGNERYDEFHISGYGTGVHSGIQINVGSVFFISTLLKGGFIHMPDIRTTLNESDRATQHFWYLQLNGTFGLRFNLQGIKKAS